MAYTNINKSSEYFNTKLYTGTGSSMSVTGVGFRPDWLWIKTRNVSNASHIVDVVRGNGQAIASDLTDGQYSSGVTSFDSDGFSLTGGIGAVNNSNGSTNYVAWNWLGGGTGVSNTDGSITSTVSANTTSGFSIVTYTSGGGSGTVGHSLGSVPKVMFYKPLSTSGGWDVYHHSLGISNRLNLHNTSASSSGYFQTLPTSSVFTEPNLYSGENVIMYCFAEKKGFSKFGSYTGNGNADGTFIYTGFKPAFFMWKIASTTGSWGMLDNKRDTFNVVGQQLFPNSSSSENSYTVLDFCSNGIKMRNTFGDTNPSGGSLIYMAFAENPLVGTNGVPATAR
jgi:hypothetical protein